MKRMSILIHRAMGIAAVLFVAATFISAGLEGWWLSDLIANLRMHLLVGAAPFLVYSVLRRQREMMLAFGIAIVSNGLLAMGHWTVTPAAETADVSSLRVVTLNVRKSNDDYAQVIEFLLDQNADIVIIQEVSPGWSERLSSLSAKYPYSVREVRPDHFGIAMLSRLQPSQVYIRYLEDGTIPFASMHFEQGGFPFTVLGIHLSWPMTPREFRMRNAQIVELAGMATSSPYPLIACGDFNLSNWSRWFTWLQREGGLTTAYTSVADTASWPNAIIGLGISIDHCFVQQPVEVTARLIGPDVGSDHRPVTFELQGFRISGEPRR